MSAGYDSCKERDQINWLEAGRVSVVACRVHYYRRRVGAHLASHE